MTGGAICVVDVSDVPIIYMYIYVAFYLHIPCTPAAPTVLLSYYEWISHIPTHTNTHLLFFLGCRKSPPCQGLGPRDGRCRIGRHSDRQKHGSRRSGL